MAKKIDTCQSEKQLFELYGSWGYKEYLPVKDLVELKEKYLKHGYRTFHLNCVITLYYTTTSKTYLKYSDDILNMLYMINDKLNVTRKSKLPSKSTVAIVNAKKNYLQNLVNFTNFDQGSKLVPNSSMFFMMSSLPNDLRKLYKSSDMFDLIIQAPYQLESVGKCDSETTVTTTTGKKLKNFKAHKLILTMRSVVFEKMFSENFASNKTNVVVKSSSSGQARQCSVDVLKIVDFDAYTVDLFLKYLYTDLIEINYDEFDESDSENEESQELSILSENNENNDSSSKQMYANLLVDLFRIADKYCVNKLRQICELKLMRLLNCHNLIHLLILAFLHNAVSLKRRCYEFLADNVHQIIKQKEWSYLENNYPSLIAEAFRMLFNK